MLMRYHWGLGVGHLYTRNEDGHGSAQGSAAGMTIEQPDAGSDSDSEAFSDKHRGDLEETAPDGSNFDRAHSLADAEDPPNDADDDSGSDWDWDEHGSSSGSSDSDLDSDSNDGGSLNDEWDSSDGDLEYVGTSYD